MELSEHDHQFIVDNPSAAMITVAADCVAKTARISIGFVDSRLWSSATSGRVRTARLRTDPRSTLYVHEARFGFLGLETTVTIIDGPNVPTDTVRLFRLLQQRPTGPLQWFTGELSEEEMKEALVADGRVLYDFEVHAAYGLR